MLTAPPEQPFVGYVGYVENQQTATKTNMSICDHSIYAPLDPVVYTQRPSTSAVQHNASQCTSGGVFSTYNFFALDISTLSTYTEIDLHYS